MTLSHLEALTKTLGVTIPESEKEEYRILTAVYHESAEKLMAMDGMVPFVSYEPLTHLRKRDQNCQLTLEPRLRPLRRPHQVSPHKHPFPQAPR